MINKIDKSYKTIGEVVKILNLKSRSGQKLPTHTIRFWEKEFKQIQPKVFDGNRRYYDKSNVDLFVNLPKTVIYFLPKIEYNFKNNIIDIFKDFDFLSLQITKLDENFYTSLVLSKAESANEVSKTSSNLIENNRIEIDKKINTKPYLIKSHLDNSTEIIFQDNSNYIYQISSNFQKIWMDSISAKIKSKIYQIDYYR